jgi:hypothetical protein
VGLFLSGRISARASFSRGLDPNADAANDGGLSPDDGSIGPAWGWFDASGAFRFGRVPGQAADAPSSGWSGVERLQSFAAPRPAPLVSSAHGASGSSSSGASGATPPDPAIAAIIASQEQNGSLSYNAVLTILDDAAAGGMTAAKFAALEGFALSSTRPAASASRLT